jgi:hypothetical protein
MAINKTQLNKLRALINKNKAYLDSILTKKESDEKKYSMSLSMAVLMEYVLLNQTEAFDSLTEGGDDYKFDAFYFNDEGDLSELTIIQSKYKLTDGETDTIHEDQIKLCIANCRKFLTGDNFQNANTKLKEKIKTYRELLRENGNPSVSVKLFFSTNGLIHEQHKILPEVKSSSEFNIIPIFVDATEFGFTSSAESGELNVSLKNDDDKTDSIFQIEDEMYSGKIVSCSIRELMNFYASSGKKILLNHNVRYLIKSSTINADIRNSFISDPKRFCYLHNGITMICSSYKLEPTGAEFTKLKIENPSIINGGQTIATLFNLYETKLEEFKEQFEKAKIIIKVYKVPSAYSLIIAQATNSQNPISIVDLKANDLPQEKVKIYFAQSGVGLITKLGEDVTYYDDTITNETLLQVYASLYADEPSKAKLSKAYIFKKYYPIVFNSDLDDVMLKKLLRCYQIANFISKQDQYDKSRRQNGFYGIVYTMKKLERNILNENIPALQILQHFRSAFTRAVTIIDKIIEAKQHQLKSKFSMNNLFKGSEIKDLIDLELENVT